MIKEWKRCAHYFEGVPIRRGLSLISFSYGNMTNATTENVVKMSKKNPTMKIIGGKKSSLNIKYCKSRRTGVSVETEIYQQILNVKSSEVLRIDDYFWRGLV